MLVSADDYDRFMLGYSVPIAREFSRFASIESEQMVLTSDAAPEPSPGNWCGSSGERSQLWTRLRSWLSTCVNGYAVWM